jgi:hypothetical protein
MSLLLATALLAAPATLPSCSWDRPGVNPFVGDVVAAVDRYADIPADVRSKLKARMAKRQYDEIATITRTAISGKARYEGAIRDMHFGAGQVCQTVTRSRWSEQHQERGLVYCESGHCIIVPTVCRNVSRITRLEARAEAPEAPPIAQAAMDSPVEEDSAITAGSDAQDEAMPRLRSGGAFGGFLPSAGGVTGTAPGGSSAGGAPLPDGIGPRMGAAVGSVLSTVKKTVREAIDLVTALPLFSATSEGSSPDPAVPTALTLPGSPGSPSVPDTPAPAGLPGQTDAPGVASTPADPSMGSTPAAGGGSGAATDPGPSVAAGPAPAPGSTPGDGTGPVTEPVGPGSAGGNGEGGGNGGDPVVQLIEDIEQSLEVLPIDEVPGDAGSNPLPGGGGEGGGGSLPQGGGALPEPATPVLVLLAGLAAAVTARRRRV